MMDRNDLTLTVAGALIAAILLGWTLRWLFGRLNSRGPGTAQPAELATQRDMAEAARLRAEMRLAEVESELGARLAASEDAREDALRRLEAALGETRGPDGYDRSLHG